MTAWLPSSTRTPTGAVLYCTELYCIILYYTVLHAYRDKLVMPKLVINCGNDEFFNNDNARYW